MWISFPVHPLIFNSNASRDSYLASSELEIFSLMIAVVGSQQWQDVRPEYEHKGWISANNLPTMQALLMINETYHV